MLKGFRRTITMTEGDYGLDLPIKIIGATFDSNDKVKMIIKTKANGDVLLEKDFENIEENTINFSLTEEESLIFKPLSYVYILDWYRDNEFLCNIVGDGIFKVEDKY